MLGYVTSFKSNYYCRMCKVYRRHAQREPIEDEGLLRNQGDYDDDVHTNDPSTTGIRYTSVLNSLPYYHVTHNFALDIMHDFLEGILPLEMKLVLGKILERGAMTLGNFNSRLQSFNYGFLDKRNRPCSVSSHQIANPGGPSGQKAAQMKCLMLYFPLLIGDKVEEEYEYWDLLLQILEIFKLVSAPKISKMATFYLRSKIEDHHVLFLRLFPDRKLTPKQHNCTHYPRAIRRLGPLSQYSVMRMEGKHKELKKWAKASNNFKNIAKTLAERHQQAQGFRFLMNQDISSRSIKLGNQVVVKASTFENCDEVVKALGCPPDQDVIVVTSAEINGYTYRPNVKVLLSWTCEPQFANVDQMVIADGRLKLIVKPWTTPHFHQHYHAYAVKESSHPVEVKVPENLFDHKPLHTVKCYDVRNPVWFIVTHFKLA